MEIVDEQRIAIGKCVFIDQEFLGSNIILEINMFIIIVTISASLYRIIRSNHRNMIKPCIVSYKNHVKDDCLVSYTIFVNLVSIIISKLKNIIMPAALSNILPTS